MVLFRKKPQPEKTELDNEVEERLKKYPKKVRKKLRLLYQDYKEGKLIFPEGYDKSKFLNKE